MSSMKTPDDNSRASNSAMAQELAITRAALAEIRRFNRLRTDLDAYLYEVINYGLGKRKEAPLPSDYGLDQEVTR